MYISITSYQGSGLKCYACGHEDDDCSAGMSGVEVTCQMSNEEDPNYGDTCYVGHTGTYLIFSTP